MLQGLASLLRPQISAILSKRHCSLTRILVMWSTVLILNYPCPIHLTKWRVIFTHPCLQLQLSASPMEATNVHTSAVYLVLLVS